ncbi:uncharacterized protein LOC133319321 [Danaus plexippus]|uniref:uncharacterized protein LOC133319321 n=1 Tax=Danaus plexippus TaxID=13037 RepID=UPI002AB0DBC0|nr:uncharacterized protein LOC133319321 [Danaus plexippus]
MKISLPTFHLEQSDLPTMLNTIGFLLRLVTINIDVNNKKRIPLINYVLVTIGIVCYFYVYVFSMSWFIFIRTRETRDYETATVVVSLLLSSLTTVTKMMFFLFCRKPLQNLVQEYLEYDDSIGPETSFHTHLHKYLPKIKRRVISVWSSIMFLLLLYVWIPIIKPGRNLPDNSYVIYGLEPTFETPNYEIALITIIISVTMGVYAMTCFLTFILIIAGYIEAQMRALSDEILEIWDGAIKNYEKVDSKFVNITKDKQLNTFEGLFRVTMALDFIILMITIVVELFKRIEDTYIELIYSFIQLNVACYMGQKLLDASDEFEFSVYDCQWEKFDRSNMRMVLMILLNAQKPLVITAGKITVLDYVCLISVIKSTYTIYTTLQSTLS